MRTGTSPSTTAMDPDADYAAMPQAAFHVPGVIGLWGAENCTIENCRVAHVGWYGIELGEGCFGNRIVGNTITDLARAASSSMGPTN